MRGIERARTPIRASWIGAGMFSFLNQSGSHTAHFLRLPPQRSWLRYAGPIGQCQLKDTGDGILAKGFGKNIVAAEPDDFP